MLRALSRRSTNLSPASAIKQVSVRVSGSTLQPCARHLCTKKPPPRGLFRDGRWIHSDGLVEAGKVLGIRRAANWEEMPPNVQANWRILGWTPESWSGEWSAPFSADKYFTELSPPEKAAAKALGYTSAEMWDNDPEDPFKALEKISSPSNAAVQAMKNKNWDELTAAQRECWLRLGWTRPMWDFHPQYGTPSSSDKFFWQLSVREKEAARGLGYDENLWDNDDEDAGGSSSNLHTFLGFDHELNFSRDNLSPEFTSVLTFILAFSGLAVALAVEAQYRRRSADGATTGTTTHLTRQAETPRPNWLQRAEASGLTFADLPGICWGHWLVSEWPLLPQGLIRRLGIDQPYWNESASYKLSDEGAWRIESAAFELHSMLLEATDEIIRSDVLLAEFGVAEELWPAVRRSWHARQVDFIGRFDLVWDGVGEPKLAEYNADTPTVLIEAGAAQRDWCRDVHPDKGQFNVLDEALVAAWRSIAETLATRYGHLKPGQLTLAIAAQGVSDNTRSSTKVLAQGRRAACLPGRRRATATGEGWDSARRRRRPSTWRRAARGAASLRQDGQLGHLPQAPPKVLLRSIDHLTVSDLQEDAAAPQAMWKLYPWEWIAREAIGLPFTDTTTTTTTGLFGNLSKYAWSAKPSAGSAPPGFVPSATFSGARSGYVYKNGNQGMGYYLEEYRRHRPLEQICEPPWKLVMSSKAMLAYLWSKYPDHKNLLPAAMADDLTALGSDLSSYRAKDWVSKPALGREGHGLLYGDEWKARGDVPAHALASNDPAGGLKAFASAVVESDEGVSILPRVDAPPEMPTSGDAVAIVKQVVEHNVSSTVTGVSQLLDRTDLSKRSDELDKTVVVDTGPAVIQKYYELPELMGRKVVTSCWVVRGLPVSACFREDTLARPTTIAASCRTMSSPA